MRTHQAYFLSFLIAKKKRNIWALSLDVEISSHMLETYSGSRYPLVPITVVDTSLLSSVGKTFERPKSAIFASKFSANKILAVFTSLWTIGGLQPWCKYSSPARQPKEFTKILLESKIRYDIYLTSLEVLGDWLVIDYRTKRY